MRPVGNTARGEGRGAIGLALRPSLFALSLLAGALPVGAQVAVTREAPLRFAVAWARGTPQGELAEVAEAPEGFVAWLSLPIDRAATIGLRAEFSVLTFPEQRVALAFEPDITLDATVRGTIGFTGVGPRVELRTGPVSLSVAAMAGYARVITDLTGQVANDVDLISIAESGNEYAVAGKVSADAYLPVYRGIRGTALGAALGVDYTTGGRTALPRRDSFGVGDDGRLTLQRPEVPPAMLVVRAGVSLEF